MKKTSVFQNSLIWFGAGVSIAEILTGTYFAPLGMAKGFAAILLGHLIGCTMMFFAGLIGGRTGLSAMETSKLSFGKKGSLWFAALNVLQLVGWTAIMIYDGALAANGIAGVGAWLWCLVIGALILVWILIGLTDLGRINQVVMVLLFVLTLVMCKVIFFGGNGIMTAQDDSLSFGAAVELAVAMPLSWLPLISDYTRDAEKPTQATWVSVLAYGAITPAKPKSPLPLPWPALLLTALFPAGCTSLAWALPSIPARAISPRSCCRLALEWSAC